MLDGAFERPPQRVAERDRHGREDQADLQVLRQAGLQPKQREDEHLREHRDDIADGDVGERLDERRQPQLLHSASRSQSRSSRFITVETCQRPP